MSDPIIFTIEHGELGLKIVDTAELGYLDTWQAPGGAGVDEVTLADYDTGSGGFTCQMTAGALTAAANTTTQDIPATFCSPARSVPQPGETSYSLDLSFLQDPNVAIGLSAYLYENDTLEAYAYFGMDNGEPPRMIGRVRLSAGTIGGEARATLTADVSLPLVRRPDIEFGNATTSRIVLGAGTGGAPALAAAETPSTPASTPEPAPVG